MKHRHAALVIAVLLAGTAAAELHAQATKPGPEQKPPQDDAAAVVPLQVDVVVSRWQGDRKVSSQPYALSVNTGRPAIGGTPNIGPVTQLRIGNEVPVVSTIVPGPDSKTPAPPYTATNYRNIGTRIDCSARSIAQDNRFEVQLSIEESDVARGDKQPGGAPAGAPVFSTFSANNRLLLRDGQTRQFAVATDRITGEVVKIEVTLRVVK